MYNVVLNATIILTILVFSLMCLLFAVKFVPYHEVRVSAYFYYCASFNVGKVSHKKLMKLGRTDYSTEAKIFNISS